MPNRPRRRPLSRRVASVPSLAAPADPAGTLQGLLAIVQGTGIADLEVEWDGGSIRLQRDPSPWEPRPASEEPTPATNDDQVIVHSAYVGVFHRDGEQTYPDVGDLVSEGSAIGEVETLSIRNAVIAPAAGVLAELSVEAPAPVEYGQPLAVIRVMSAE